MRNDASRAAYEMNGATHVSATSLLKLCLMNSSSRLWKVCEPQWVDIHGTLFHYHRLSARARPHIYCCIYNYQKCSLVSPTSKHPHYNPKRWMLYASQPRCILNGESYVNDVIMCSFSRKIFKSDDIIARVPPQWQFNPFLAAVYSQWWEQRQCDPCAHPSLRTPHIGTNGRIRDRYIFLFEEENTLLTYMTNLPLIKSG